MVLAEPRDIIMRANRNRGDVIWSSGLIKEERPWLIISNGDHPYNDQYTAVALTTTDEADTHPISEDDMAEGELPKQTYASPSVVEQKFESEILRHCGTLTDEAVDQIVREVVTYFEP